MRTFLSLLLILFFISMSWRVYQAALRRYEREAVFVRSTCFGVKFQSHHEGLPYYKLGEKGFLQYQCDFWAFPALVLSLLAALLLVMISYFRKGDYAIADFFFGFAWFMGMVFTGLLWPSL